VRRRFRAGIRKRCPLVPKPRLKILSEEFKAQSFGVKGIKAGGVRLAGKAVKRIAVKTRQ
jgi:hypothetical protein